MAAVFLSGRLLPPLGVHRGAGTAVLRSLLTITGCSPAHWAGGTGGRSLPLCTA